MTNQHRKGHARAQIIADAAHCRGCRRFWAGEAAERNKRGVNMALTRDFRETVQARVKRDAAFRRGFLAKPSKAFFLARCQSAKSYCAITSMQMFGPNGNPTARNLFDIFAYLRNAEGVRFEVRSTRAALRTNRRPSSRQTKRTAGPAASDGSSSLIFE